MANEIANYTDIYRKTSLGHDNNQCPNKTSVLGISNEIKINGTYTDNQCVLIDDIERYAEDWRYTFKSSDYTLNFSIDGEEIHIIVTSYKERYVNGNSTGERVTVGYTRLDSKNVSGSGTILIMKSTNTDTTGTVTLTQDESNNVITITCNQTLPVSTSWDLEVWNNTNKDMQVLRSSILFGDIKVGDAFLDTVNENNLVYMINVPSSIDMVNSSFIVRGYIKGTYVTFPDFYRLHSTEGLDNVNITPIDNGTAFLIEVGNLESNTGFLKLNLKPEENDKYEAHLWFGTYS